MTDHYDDDEDKLRMALTQVTKRCPMCEGPMGLGQNMCWHCYGGAVASDKVPEAAAQAEDMVRTAMRSVTACSACGKPSKHPTDVSTKCYHCHYQGRTVPLLGLQRDVLLAYVTETWLRLFPSAVVKNAATILPEAGPRYPKRLFGQDDIWLGQFDGRDLYLASDRKRVVAVAGTYIVCYEAADWTFMGRYERGLYFDEAIRLAAAGGLIKDPVQPRYNQDVTDGDVFMGWYKDTDLWYRPSNREVYANWDPRAARDRTVTLAELVTEAMRRARARGFVLSEAVAVPLPNPPAITDVKEAQVNTDIELRTILLQVTAQCPKCKRPAIQGHICCWSCFGYSEGRHTPGIEEQAQAERMVRNCVATLGKCPGCHGSSACLPGVLCSDCYYKVHAFSPTNDPLPLVVAYAAELWVRKHRPAHEQVQRETGLSAVATAPAIPAPSAPAWTATYDPDEWGW